MMRLLLIAIAATVCSIAMAQDAGLLTLKVTTSPIMKSKKKVKYSPRHVIAVWVVDNNGKFVRTLLLAGKKRAKYLKTWRRSSKKNKVDAVTSATRKTHQTETITWNCKDAEGNLVPDGKYEIKMELTSKNGSGPKTPKGYLIFTKGAETVSLKPRDLANFTKIELTYTPGS